MKGDRRRVVELATGAQDDAPRAGWGRSWCTAPIEPTAGSEWYGCPTRSPPLPSWATPSHLSPAPGSAAKRPVSVHTPATSSWPAGAWETLGGVGTIGDLDSYPPPVECSRARWPVRAALGLALALFACTTPADRTSAGPQPSLTDDPVKLTVFTLGSVEVRTRDVFSDERAAKSALARLVNATHWTTRERVIRRELWIQPGQPIRPVDVEELERNLRATGMFAEVRATLVPSAVEGLADLVIETEDRLSLAFGGSGSFVGAVSSVGAALSENNLLGSGDRLSLSFSENSENEFRGTLSYVDRHFAGSWITASARIGRTEDGEFGALSFDRPFKHLADRGAWRLSVAKAESGVDYFAAGDTVAEAPLVRETLEGAVFQRYGPAEQSWTVGLRGQYDTFDFDRVSGPAAGSIRVPGDTETTLAGLTVGLRSLFGFRKVQGLDTLDYIQDVALSAGFDALLGATARTEVAADDSVQPTLSLGTHLTFEALPDTLVAVRTEARGRTRGGDPQSWNVGFDLSAFELSLRPHTLAAHFSYDEADTLDELPVQFTLDENQGLRGYPARELTGTRVARINLEDRIDLGARLGAFHFGAVVFFDAGWIEDGNEGFGRPLRSAGFGLRIGSGALLGARVARIDVSFPLDDYEGQSFDPLVSLSFGQVFGLR